MASPLLREKTREFVDQRSSSESAALRLLSAERSEEIFPILLEEIVFLGSPRALVLDADFDTGEVKPTASLNCDKAYLRKFTTSLWASENPIITVLQNLKPGMVRSESKEASLYAVQNFQLTRKFQIQEQICDVCGMRGYASLVLGEVPKSVPESELRQFRNLV